MITEYLKKLYETIRSVAGITVVLAIVVAILSSIFRGPYIIVNTVVTGGMLALMSIGLALVFGVMNVAQFAHGEYFMIGSLTAYYTFIPIERYLGANPNAALSFLAPLVSILAAFCMGALMGVLSEKLIFYNLRKRSRTNWVMNSFLLTVGISVLLVNGHQLIFGTELKGIVRYWTGRPFCIMDVFVSRDRCYAFILSVLVIGLFWLFMKATRTGRAIRAVSQDETGAQMVGIDLSGIQVLTMALSCGLAGIAGASLLFMFPSYPSVGLDPLYMSWFVIILAGMGNVLGAVVGAFMVALLKVLTMEYIGSGWDFVVPTALIMLILIFKPNGIFGSDVRGVLEQ
ncbi:MAG: branched-chain amino acid ABC transporter permease [Desulfobacterales bacterium]|nr:branched-chain amino acid ABC transporter permease [Desulfobacterales bacterium]HIJ55304.1 branched-chain amino acid ABC transporter permease [Deltaproteobacteria bacterium]